MNKLKRAEEFLKHNGFKKATGWAIDTESMNPEGFEEIFFQGKKLEKAMGDYARQLKEYWIYEACEEVVFEDMWQAIEYAEDMTGSKFK